MSYRLKYSIVRVPGGIPFSKTESNVSPSTVEIEYSSLATIWLILDLLKNQVEMFV